MADAICRWRNSSIKQLIEFNSIFPLEPINKDKGRKIVEKNWEIFGGSSFFTTPYQLAAQMGVYYESETMMFPRFTKLINIEDACEYLKYWGKNYYAPNPYTKSIQQEKAVVINKFLVNWVKDEGLLASFSSALNKMFSSDIGNTDILINMLNNFSEVLIENDIVSLKDNSIPRYADSDVWLDVKPNDKESFFRLICSDKFKTSYNTKDMQTSLQQIYFGAPGTGKSHKIKEQLESVSKENIFRTTFHPDSDYSSFVGCYKPSMEKSNERLYSKEELINKLTELKEQGATYVPQKFGAKYWYSLKQLTPQDKKDILLACEMSDNYTVEFDKGIAVGEEYLKSSNESRIIYRYTPQVFLKAYMQAYRTTDNVYLIVEEINRGNCAQIFGDLFQLLDRDANGKSEYTIKADDDLKAFLEEELGKDSEAIKDGELCLPSNLYIWATMNTSDQSLFPIDSAFKRRWDWEYEPIKYKNTDWVICINDVKYSWISFQREVNKRILAANSSEDKMLGDYFVNPHDGIITEKILLNKILFYLWNDVCKEGEGEIFKISETEDVSFSDLHGDGASEKLVAMLEFLKIQKVQ